MTRCLSAACLCLLAGCATDAQHGRSRIVAPSEVGAAYSEVELQARLVLTPDVSCEAHGCASVDEFRARVRHIAERVTDAAYQLAFELDIQTPVSFNVDVPGKDDIGTLSSATGNIIVFDGLRELDLPDAALAFLVAREMGHVLARHHDENSATSIGISIAVAVMFPMANVLRGVEAAYATATTASLASTAVSMAGSRIVRGLYKSEQQQEADVLALRILGFTDWTAHEVANDLAPALSRLGSEGWLAELQASQAWLETYAQGPPVPPRQAYPSLRLAALEIEAEQSAAHEAEVPVVAVMAVDLFGPRLAERHGARRLADVRAPWGLEPVCRARLPAVAVRAPAPPVGKPAVVCAKTVKRGICPKPALKKPAKPAMKRVVRPAGKRR